MPGCIDDDRMRGYEDIHEVLIGASEKLQPKHMDAYECPICKEWMICSKKEAEEHVRKPLIKVPRGLVYAYGRNGFSDFCSISLIDDEGTLVYPMNITRKRLYPYAPSGTRTNAAIRRDVEPHTFMQGEHSYSFYAGKVDNGGYQQENSLFIVQDIANNQRFLLSEQDFERFKQVFPEQILTMSSFPPKLKPEELVRTTPELERLIVEMRGE